MLFVKEYTICNSNKAIADIFFMKGLKMNKCKKIQELFNKLRDKIDRGYMKYDKQENIMTIQLNERDYINKVTIGYYGLYEVKFFISSDFIEGHNDILEVWFHSDETTAKIANFITMFIDSKRVVIKD